jgi:hypothetical protein
MEKQFPVEELSWEFWASMVISGLILTSGIMVVNLWNRWKRSRLYSLYDFKARTNCQYILTPENNICTSLSHDQYQSKVTIPGMVLDGLALLHVTGPKRKSCWFNMHVAQPCVSQPHTISFLSHSYDYLMLSFLNLRGIIRTRSLLLVRHFWDGKQVSLPLLEFILLLRTMIGSCSLLCRCVMLDLAGAW